MQNRETDSKPLSRSNQAANPAMNTPAPFQRSQKKLTTNFMRILLIEEDRELAAYIVRGLRAERFAADWADAAEKGLAWAKWNSYDLGIFDATLTGISGIETCQRLRQRGTTFPIIILSATTAALTKAEALNCGADDFLSKPFFMAELVA